MWLKHQHALGDDKVGGARSLLRVHLKPRQSEERWCFSPLRAPYRPLQARGEALRPGLPTVCHVSSPLCAHRATLSAVPPVEWQYGTLFPRHSPWSSIPHASSLRKSSGFQSYFLTIYGDGDRLDDEFNFQTRNGSTSWASDPTP